MEKKVYETIYLNWPTSLVTKYYYGFTPSVLEISAVLQLLYGNYSNEAKLNGLKQGFLLMNIHVIPSSV